MTLTFRVNGIAQAKGNLRPVRRGSGILTDTNKNVKTWQVLIAAAASQEINRLAPTDRALLAGPVTMSIAFHLPRPVSLKASVLAHIRKPDIDKITRAVFDALEGVVYFSDSQIVNLVTTKRYASTGAIPFVAIRVEPAIGLRPLAVHQPLFETVQ